MKNKYLLVNKDGSFDAIKESDRLLLNKDIIGIIIIDNRCEYCICDLCKICKHILNNENIVVIQKKLTDSNINKLGNLFAKYMLLFMSNVKCRNPLTNIIGIPIKYWSNSYMNLSILDIIILLANKKVRFDNIQLNNNMKSNISFMELLRIFQEPLLYTLSSIIGASTEFVSFYLLMKIPIDNNYLLITLSTVIARTIGSIINFIINKTVCFKSKGHTPKQALLYSLLFVCKMFLSSNLVSLLSTLSIPIMLSKVLVDGCLFFIGYTIQKRNIFKED